MVEDLFDGARSSFECRRNQGAISSTSLGDDVSLLAFSMTSTPEWDSFRNIDMDKQESIIKSGEGSSAKQSGNLNADKVAAVTAWHRVDTRAREALRRCFLLDSINGYEERIRTFIMDSEKGDVLELHVQDPFQRLLLHGVCEFYNLVSTTVYQSGGTGSSKMTSIRKKRSGSVELPNITLCNFLKMAKEGFW